jgi:leader peptidase (prepilin peptidase)/N-methyltransferase
VEPSRPVLAVVVLVAAVVLGPWLARVAVRLGTRDAAAVPGPLRTGVTTGLLAALLAGAAELTGLRPVTAALAWAAGAAVVLGATDLLGHRLPDRVTYPAAVVCGSALLVDAAVEGTWTALLRGLAAGVVVGAIGGLAWLVSPQGLGLGDAGLGRPAAHPPRRVADRRPLRPAAAGRRGARPGAGSRAARRVRVLLLAD